MHCVPENACVAKKTITRSECLAAVSSRIPHKTDPWREVPDMRIRVRFLVKTGIARERDAWRGIRVDATHRAGLISGKTKVRRLLVLRILGNKGIPSQARVDLERTVHLPIVLEE